MRVIKKEIKTVEQEFLEDLCCNKCGKSCKHIVTQGADGKDVVQYEFAVVSASFGYWSHSDGSIYDFDLCEDCFYELFNSLKIKPEDKGDW